MRRRELLHPRHVAGTAGQVIGLLGELEPSAAATAPPAEEVALLRLGWRAMATRYEIVTPLDAPRATEAAQEAFELLDELEDQLSVYRDHSEVSRLNRTASQRAVRVESRLFALLQLAEQVHRDSGGAYDVTAGALIKAWGFFKGPRRVPGETELVAARRRVGMGQVELSVPARTVRYRTPGLEINLGSIGKGYALDRMAELLTGRRWKLPAVLLHGGSSSVYAKGCPHPGSGDGRGWRVRVRHPWVEGAALCEVWLRDRAMGTSAATFQHLEHQGRKLGHVLDPRTGWPASGLDSATVLAPSGALADALSTAFFVGGIEVARRYCAAHPEVAAILLPEGADVPEVIGLSERDLVMTSLSPRATRNEPVA